ncbi:MAG: HAD hydrolase-like protein [Deltaproteobacteria bacterium]|nr:HAD hydrolase-like protein [Deltaproteobacteria bacterium]
MIDPNGIAFDIDGVVADTMSLFLDIAKQEYNITNIKYEDITDYDLSACLNMPEEIIEDIVEKIIDGKYSTKLKPIEGAAEVLKKVSEHSEKLLFITARPRIGKLKGWFFSEFMPDILPSQVEIVLTGSFEAKKDILFEMKKKWFIEDRILTCFDLYEAGITPIVYIQPWNITPHPFLKVKNWRNIEQLIEF